MAAAALSEALSVPVWTVPSGKWKKQALANGRATKAQIQAWVRSQRIEFDGQDEADAICIAWAGRGMVQSGRWEAAA